MNTIKKIDYVIAVTLLLLLTGSIANAQNQAIKSLKVDDGTNSSAYNTNALVDLQSGTKGLLLPRIALTATSSASPLGSFTAGMTVYNTATAGDVTPGYYYSDGTKWVRLADATASWLLTGNSGTTAGTNFLGTTDAQDLIFKQNGVQAGWLNTSNYSTAFGVGSLPKATAAGYNNTAMGYKALANTTSNGNTAVGYVVLSTNAAGYNNTAVGMYAMSGAVGANSNSAFGTTALQSTTGTGNTAIGSSSLLQLGTGSNNIALGSNTGGSQTSGSTNIVIGASQNLASLTGSNQLNIGGAIFGTGLTGLASAPAGNIGIGTTNPQQRLEVRGQIMIDTLLSGAITDSIVTVAKGSGAGGLLRAVSATTLIGNNAWSLTGNSGTTPGTNFIGTTDAQDLIFKRNNIQAGWLGANNTAFGTGSLPNTGSGANNTAIGYQTLFSNSYGNNNTAMGYQALYNNTFGAGNMSIGYNSLYSNTTGGYNVAIGYNGLYSNTAGVGNVAIGYNGLYNNTAGQNIAIGYQTLYSNTTGGYNVAIGYQAGYNQASGSTNIVIGASQNLASLTGSNQLNIGGAIFGTGMTGSVSAPAGNIGINTATPGNTLEIKSTAANTSGLRFTNLPNVGLLGTNANGDVVSVVTASSGSSVSKQRLINANSSVVLNTPDGNYSIRYDGTATGAYWQIRNNQSTSQSVAVFIEELWNNGSAGYDVHAGTQSLTSGTWTNFVNSTGVGTTNELNVHRVYDLSTGTIYRIEGMLITNVSTLQEAVIIEQF